jgi:DNA-binding GntR family transcriptional regulator
VVRASAGEGSPLAYFRGRYGRIELTQDAEAYRQLRDLILTRQVSADERLDVERLANQLESSPSAVQYALTRLVTENLVIRGDRGHVVKPLDVATSNAAHDARMAIELGVADLISRALRTQDEIEDVLAHEHLDLVQAYQRADRDAVRDIIIRHTAHAKRTQQRGIERAGGQL